MRISCCCRLICLIYLKSFQCLWKKHAVYIMFNPRQTYFFYKLLPSFLCSENVWENPFLHKSGQIVYHFLWVKTKWLPTVVFFSILRFIIHEALRSWRICRWMEDDFINKKIANHLFWALVTSSKEMLYKPASDIHYSPGSNKQQLFDNAKKIFE